MSSIDGIASGVQWLTSFSEEFPEVNLTQEKVEQIRAALLDPNAEPLAHNTAVELSKNTLALIHAVASLKNTHNAAAINEQLASGVEIQSAKLKELAKAASIDLGPFLLLSDDQGRLIALLDKRSDEGTDELVVSTQDKVAYCLRASGSPAALACLINHFQIKLSDLLKQGLAEPKLESSLPFLRHCDLHGIDDKKQAAWLFKSNPHKLQQLFIKSDEITALPAQLPLLQELNCSGCKKLSALPAQLPLLQKLDCSWCQTLRSLPEQLPLLQKLDCGCCSWLSALPAELPQLQELDCSGCNKLSALPAQLPLLQKLNCCCCNWLRALPAQLPLLKVLFCWNCPELRALPAQLPLLRELICSGCTALCALPAHLPQLQVLEYSECPQLDNVMLPEVPGTATVYSGRIGSGFSNMNIPLHTLKETPLFFLLELGTRYLLQGRPFPNISYVEESGEYSKAIDVGGVRRDFVSTLLENLFIDTEHCEKLRRHSGMPLITGIEHEETAYRSLGRLLALCYQGTAARFVAGPLFNSSFYRALATYPDSTQVALALLALPADVEDILNGRDSASDEAYLKAYHLIRDSIECNEIHRRFFATQEHREELAEQLMLSLSDPSIQKRYQALQWIADEMKSGLGEPAWTALQARPYEEIQTSIEGSLDKAQIKRVLQWTNNGCSDEEMLRTQAWMDRWLDHTEDYSSLLRAVTGSNALRPGCPITLELYRRGQDYIPIAHTCSGTMDLSGQYPDYATFKEKLTYLLAQARAGFDFA